jgi:tetratricopeptide (TPR) repeat protein
MAMGEAHESQGNIDRAMNDYAAALHLVPNRPNVHFRMGRALLARGDAKGSSKDLEEAAKQFQLELQVDPSMQMPLMNSEKLTGSKGSSMNRGTALNRRYRIIPPSRKLTRGSLRP